jgi:Holliday junction resolvase RusA-like endonuclease
VPDVILPERGPAVLRFAVPGVPAGAGSKTAEPLGKRFKEARDQNGRLILKYRPASEKTEPWMDLVHRCAEFVARRDGLLEPLDGALWLDCLFYIPRVASHYYQRKSGPVLRPDAPMFPAVTSEHDVDKMRRAISDSLTRAKVIADDKRIVGGEDWRLYDDQGRGPRAIIVLGRMLHQTTVEAGLVTAPAGQETLT